MTLRRARLALPALVLLAMALAPRAGASTGSTTAPSLVRTNWLQYEFDARRDGFNPYETRLNPTTVSGLQPAWIAHLSTYVKSPVAVANGHVFQPDYTDVFSFDAKTGVVDWDSYIGYEAGAAPAVLGRTVYVCGLDSIWAYDASTGSNLW